MKLSEELRIRGAAVGDTYGRDGYGFPEVFEVFVYACTIYNSSVLERLLSLRYDEGGNFLWLVDKNGIKKEITK